MYSIYFIYLFIFFFFYIIIVLVVFPDLTTFSAGIIGFLALWSLHCV